MKYIFWLLSLPIGWQPANAQDFDRIWLSGNNEFPGVQGYGHTRLRFDSDTVLVEPAVLAFNFESTVAAMADAGGNLLFYTNGCSVANREHQVMPNGAGLYPGVISALVCAKKGYIVPQGALILPDPGNADRYYLFHLGATSDPVRKLRLGPLYYTLVDMSLDNGVGDVVSKNNILLDGDLGAFAATRHGNGRDWWLVVPEFGGNAWHVFLLSPQGSSVVNKQVLALTGPPCEKYMGTAMALRGDKIAHWGDCGVMVLNFERCTGAIETALELPAPTHWIPGGGVAFSPGGRYLYATSQNVLFRADLEAAHPKLDTARFSYDPFLQSPNDVPGNTFHHLVNGPDGVIYGSIPSRARYLHALKNPDSETVADLDFVARALQLPATGVRTLPHLPNYRLYDWAGSNCDTLGISVAAGEAARNRDCAVHLSPNPVSTLLRVTWPDCPVTAVEIWDVAGRQIVNVMPGRHSATVDVSAYPAGMYFLRTRFQSEEWRINVLSVAR